MQNILQKLLWGRELLALRPGKNETEQAESAAQERRDHKVRHRHRDREKHIRALVVRDPAVTKEEVKDMIKFASLGGLQLFLQRTVADALPLKEKVAKDS